MPPLSNPDDVRESRVAGGNGEDNQSKDSERFDIAIDSDEGDKNAQPYDQAGESLDLHFR